ncbi:MAG: TIM barrel protein [Phycisphaeraceae bacterium]
MNENRPADAASSRLSRRNLLSHAAGLAAAGAVGVTATGCTTRQTLANASPAQASKTSSGKAVRHGRIQQSIVQWCFSEHWELEETCEVAKQLGVSSIELVGTGDLPTLKKHGITCAITSIDMPDDFPFIRGFNNPAYHEMLVAETKRVIDACAEYGSPNVIAFTGFSHKDVDNMGPDSEHWTREECVANCVAGFKQVVGYAEEKGVTICMEHLNTRDDSHPMKGHPGYQGDDLDMCLEICEKVGSPRLKLLFDIYHVQIMHGDVIRRLHECRDYLGHIHTAGNPGRHELDDAQEINYPPIMRTLLELEYEGYVGQEFIPTRDPQQGLHQAVTLCDV